MFDFALVGKFTLGAQIGSHRFDSGWPHLRSLIFLKYNIAERSFDSGSSLRGCSQLFFFPKSQSVSQLAHFGGRLLPGLAISS
jgi:hypothetical protein